jgi:hypothetical protein
VTETVTFNIMTPLVIVIVVCSKAMRVELYRMGVRPTGTAYSSSENREEKMCCIHVLRIDVIHGERRVKADTADE